MRPRIRLLICDLDNTLYDWVTYFSTAFYAMVEVASQLLETSKDVLLDDLQEVHRKRHNSEEPWALLETRTVEARYAELSRAERKTLLDPAFYAFNRARKRTLAPYPGVIETLEIVSGSGCTIVGHTEATVVNALFRLHKLNLTRFLTALYAVEPLGLGHPDPKGAEILDQVPSVRRLQLHERKPDPEVLNEICFSLDKAAEETLYVGDSISRDIGMAKEAGVYSAWAKYGTKYDPEHWDRLVRITHWTDEDVKRATEAKRKYGSVLPDTILEESFSELRDQFSFVGSGT